MLMFGFFGLVVTAQAGWLDWLSQKSSSSNITSAASTASSLTQDEMVGGLKEALSKGVGQAVSLLGKDGGFLNNINVKIPMPDSLAKVEKGLRMVGQDKIADDFIETMNHAAEKAVPEAAPIFADAISKMTVEDAKAILTGPKDAATQYFRKTTEPTLSGKLLPIVKDATAKTGVTAAYKRLTEHQGVLEVLVAREGPDLDQYVTQKALDGLFKMIAEEEGRIRENPVERTSDLLKKVFAASLK